MKINIPKELQKRKGIRGKNKTCNIQEVIPYLPQKTCFFDIRHLVFGIQILPFAVTTKISCNNQQYLKVMNEDKKTEVAFSLTEGKWANMHEQSRRVYDTEGIAPTIHTCGGGNLEPKISVDGVKYVDSSSNFVSRENPDGSFDNRSYNRVWKTDGHIGACNCTKVQEIINATEDGCATTLTTAHHYSGNIVNPKRGQKEMGVKETDKQSNYRIRKLTERECFRLMGVADTDIDKIKESGISKSQQYKMAGNSIVVDVLYHIFRKMFVETKNENLQMELF